MNNLLNSPASTQKDAAGVLNSAAKDVTQSFGRMYRETSSSAQSIHIAMSEIVRQNMEHGVRFIHDITHAKGPWDAFGLQAAFVLAQMKLFAGHSMVLQREFVRLLLPFAGLGQGKSGGR